MTAAASSSARKRAESFPVWAGGQPLRRFALKRFAFMVLVPLPIAALCFSWGYGVAGLAVMAIGAWPFPFRCVADSEGLLLSWLVVRERFPWRDIRAHFFASDRRRFVIGRRASVLVLERHGGPPLTLRATPAVLDELAREMARYVPVGSGGDSAPATP